MRNSRGKLFCVFAFILLIFTKSAYGAYAWVMGSFKYPSSAEQMLRKPGFMEIGAIIVPTKAFPYKKRIIAGCFATKAEALAQRARFVSVRNNNGIWLLETNLACNLPSPIYVQRNYAHPKTKILKAKLNVFTPQKWKFKFGNKIAYTDGTHPSKFFIPSNECHIVRSLQVESPEQIYPPRERTKYFLRDIRLSRQCKVAYLYTVNTGD